MSTSVWAEYAEAPVADGGTVSGKVTLKGAPPAPKTFEFSKFPNPGFCAKVDNDGKGRRVVQEVQVGAGNGLKDVVVYIAGIEKGKPFTFDGTDVKAEGCKFLVQGGPSTFAGVVVKKKEIRILNQDADPSDPKAATGVLHNPHSYEVAGASNSTIFNLPLPEKGQTVKKPVVLRKKDSIFKVECDQHNYMQVFFQPVDNPYYAIVGEDGTFSIDGVPPGDYQVRAWHPTLGKQESKITVPAKGQAKADFAFAAK
ncbi:MAG: carboxypeptidase-like regulatory domain-containing protein [Nitrospiria bacterium]